MTLFLTDKDGEGRTHPSVNAVDVHFNRKAHATDSISPRAAGSTGGRVTSKDDRYVAYDDSNERVVIGRLPDGTYGVAVSQAGYDVSDAFS